MNARLLRPLASRSLVDDDAAAYLAAVEQADTQALEPAVRNAITAFVIGCKQDDIWNAIQAACILAGARTLTGCLIPLKGPAPEPFNFASGDYNRATGLKGDAGAAKYLNSKVNNRTGGSPQNNNHNAVWLSESEGGFLVGQMTVAVGSFGTNALSRGAARNRQNQSNANTFSSLGASNQLVGMSRTVSTGYTARVAGANESITQESNIATDSELSIFGTHFQAFYSSARLGWYSIGTSLDLALLESRLSGLFTAIGNAIP
jgi:hypothetical protein